MFTFLFIFVGVFVVRTNLSFEFANEVLRGPDALLCDCFLVFNQLVRI